MSEKLYGWYDRPDQPIDQPTENPSLVGPCLFCGSDLHHEDIRTHSLMPIVREPPRSYFYRTHRTCHEKATETQRQQIDEVILDSIAHHGD